MACGTASCFQTVPSQGELGARTLKNELERKKCGRLGECKMCVCISVCIVHMYVVCVVCHTHTRMQACICRCTVHMSGGCAHKACMQNASPEEGAPGLCAATSDR